MSDLGKLILKLIDQQIDLERRYKNAQRRLKRWDARAGDHRHITTEKWLSKVTQARRDVDQLARDLFDLGFRLQRLVRHCSRPQPA
jgi:hypothetical protein